MPLSRCSIPEKSSIGFKGKSTKPSKRKIVKPFRLVMSMATSTYFSDQARNLLECLRWLWLRMPKLKSLKTNLICTRNRFSLRSSRIWFWASLSISKKKLGSEFRKAACLSELWTWKASSKKARSSFKLTNGLTTRIARKARKSNNFWAKQMARRPLKSSKARS